MKDPLMEELTRVAREEDAREAERLERWEALNAGELSADEEAELRAAAEESEEAAVLWQAYRPLEDEFQARLVADLRRQTAGSSPSSPVAAAEPEGVSWPDRIAAAVERFFRPRQLVPVAAIALALAVFLWPAGSLPPLTGYELDLRGSVRELRSEESPAGRAEVFVDGNRFELLLTPESAVEGALAALIFVAVDGSVTALDGPESEVADEGAVRWTGLVGRDVSLPRGDCELLVVVGRPGRLPTASELAASLETAPSVETPDWLGWKVTLRVE